MKRLDRALGFPVMAPEFVASNEHTSFTLSAIDNLATSEASLKPQLSTYLTTWVRWPKLEFDAPSVIHWQKLSQSQTGNHFLPELLKLVKNHSQGIWKLACRMNWSHSQ